MDIKREENINDNGSYTKTTTRNVTKEDGWVDVDEVFGNSHESKTKKFKGKARTIQYETNDPRITRPFTIVVSSIFIVFGVISIIVGFLKQNIMIFFGIMVLITAISFLINSQKQINKIEEEIKNNVQH